MMELKRMSPCPTKWLVCCNRCHKLGHINKNPECGFQSPASHGDLSEGVLELAGYLFLCRCQTLRGKTTVFSCSSSDAAAGEMLARGLTELLWQFGVTEITVLIPYCGKIRIHRTFMISLGKIDPESPTTKLKIKSPPGAF